MELEQLGGRPSASEDDEGLSGHRSLLQEIKFHRSREVRGQSVLEGDSDYVMVTSAKLWTDLFVRHFVASESADEEHDDLLFFVRKTQIRGTCYFPKFETEIAVHRQQSKQLPIGNLDIDWEETLYLNVIMQHFDYTLTCAICSRTNSQQMQILKKQTQKVYASPSHREMYNKGDNEQITYPNIFFSIDNYEENLNKLTLRDGEVICVELVATDKQGQTSISLFNGTVHYEAIKQVYYAKAALKKRSRFSFGTQADPIEYVKMRGPSAKGCAEIAVQKLEHSGATTPTQSESNYPLIDGEWEELEIDSDSGVNCCSRLSLLTSCFCCSSHNQDNPFSQRRMSDPSSNLKNYVLGWQARRVQKSKSENQGIDGCGVDAAVLDSLDIREEVEDAKNARYWNLPGFGSTFHYWKENKRASSQPMHISVTYISLTWDFLIADMINSRRSPILTF